MSTLGQVLGYLGLGVALVMMLIAPAALVVRHLRWSRRERRYGGDITEALARQCRFFDDQADPRELTR